MRRGPRSVKRGLGEDEPTEPSELNFGMRLQKLRLDRGLTQEELAARLRMSPQQLSNLERRPDPWVNLKTLLKLQAALRVTSIEELLGEPHPAFPSTRWAALIDDQMPDDQDTEASG